MIVILAFVCVLMAFTWLSSSSSPSSSASSSWLRSVLVITSWLNWLVKVMALRLHSTALSLVVPPSHVTPFLSTSVSSYVSASRNRVWESIAAANELHLVLASHSHASSETWKSFTSLLSLFVSWFVIDLPMIFLSWSSSGIVLVVLLIWLSMMLLVTLVVSSFHALRNIVIVVNNVVVLRIRSHFHVASRIVK